MSSCGVFYIGNCDIFETKTILESKLLSLFRYPDVDKEATKFTQTVTELKQRLNLIGFTYSVAEKKFNEYKKEWLLDFTNNNETCNDDKSLFMRVDMEKISDEIGTIIMSEECLFIDEQIRNHLIHDFIEECCDENKTDIRLFVRLAIEILDDNISVCYEFGDLIDAGYYNTRNLRGIYNTVIHDNQNIFAHGEKIIILTEGKTDAEFIQGAMNVLYPHLADCYAFLDFKNGYEGSAKILSNNVKSFIATGINSKIIGIFDNDSLGCGVLKSLQSTIKVPKNVKLLHYPDIEFTKNYPTKESSSKEVKSCDINGLACSIELYFGEDSLLDDGGKLIPIQWEQSRDNANRQGSIIFKNKIQGKIRTKIDNAKLQQQLDINDWRDADRILKMIFNAFHKTIY